MLRVSTATKSITPKEPCYLAGYSMRTEKSTGVLDELKCTAVVLEVDGRLVVMCDVELLMLTREIVEDVKERVNLMYGVDKGLITLASIHTHAAPEIRSDRVRMHDEDADPSFWMGYKEFLKEEIFKTVRQCFDTGFTEVSAEYRTVSIEGYYGNRNGKDKPEDKDVTIIRFVDAEGQVAAAAVNISCHPTILSPKNLMISGDLLGYLSREVKARFGVYPVMMQGAAGDMSSRNYREGSDAKELERVGTGIAQQMFAEGEYAPLSLSDPTCEHYRYYREYDIDMEEWRERRGELVAAMEKETNYDKHKILQSSLFAVDMKMNAPHVTADYSASIIRMGEMYICKMPGELFSRFGVQIKQASPAKLTVVWGYADDYAGYMSDEGEYGRTYESLMSPLPKGGTEQITKEISEMISK